MTRITCIGLGAMGGAIAERLLATDNEVLVHDLSASAIERLVALGAEPFQPQIADVDVLVTSLPDDASVTAVLLGQSMLEQVRPALLIECSTILPDTMTRVAEVAAELKVLVVDAAVSGGPAEALAGKLTLLVGADQEALRVGQPVLEHIGSVEYVGLPGDGKAAKLVNNTMTMGNMAVAAEAFTLGVKLGLEPERLFEVLSRSGGRSHHFQKRIPYALARDFSPRFALYLSEKDLRLALRLGHDTNYAMPVASVIHQIYELARAKGLADEDMVAVIKIFENWAGLDGDID